MLRQMKGKVKMKLKLKVIAASLVIVSVLSLCSFTAHGADDNLISMDGVPDPNERWEVSVAKVSNKNVWAYNSVTLNLNSKSASSDARMINGVVYVAVRQFFENNTNMKVTYYSAKKTLNVKGSGLEMDIIDGSNVVYANSRTLFSMSPSTIMSNGRMYTPLSVISKALGLNYTYTASGRIANLSGSIKPLASGAAFYDSDAVYWLSRIISAESRGESLLGQLAVGSVVMNRVKSPLYPNTIWGVIFDRKYGVQFSPILDGSIYNTPTASAVVAAKITLEGYNVNSSALFFLHPRLSSSSWIPKNRDYLFSIGKHDFYA